MKLIHSGKRWSSSTRFFALMLALILLLLSGCTGSQQTKPVASEAFLDLLKAGDVTIEMHDYGSFEKVGALGTTLPRNDEQITTEPGDVILYQGNQVTIYYDVNSWSFTRLGKVEGVTPAELKKILGKG